MRPIPLLWYLAIAFAALDFVSSVVSAPGCGRIANLLWFIPDLRPMTSAWINFVIGVFGMVFTYAVLSLVVLAVLSSRAGGIFRGHIAAALANVVLRKAIFVALLAYVLDLLVQALVAALC